MRRLMIAAAVAAIGVVPVVAAGSAAAAAHPAPQKCTSDVAPIDCHSPHGHNPQDGSFSGGNGTGNGSVSTPEA